FQLQCYFKGQSSAKRPATQNDLAAAGVLDDVIEIRLRALFQGAFEAFDAIDGDIVRQAAHQWLVDHGGATGGMEHKYRGAISFAQHANIAFDFRLQAFADQIRQRLEGLRLSDLLGGDFYSGTLGEPLGDFCSLLRGNRRQVTATPPAAAPVKVAQVAKTMRS